MGQGQRQSVVAKIRFVNGELLRYDPEDVPRCWRVYLSLVSRLLQGRPGRACGRDLT